jgi:membrane protein
MKPRHPSNQTSLENDNVSYRTRDRRKLQHEAVLPDSTRSAKARPGEDRQARRGRGRSADKPSDISKQGWKDILWRTKDEMKKDNLSIVSAGVAFYIFLGIIPALGALISLWGFVAEPTTIQQQVDSMTGVLPPQVIEILDEQMTRLANEKSGALLATIVGILLAIWSGAKAMKALMNALNITYEEEETRGFIRLNLTAIALTFAGIIGFIIAIGIVVVLPTILEFIGLGSTAAAAVKILRWPLLAIFAVLGLGLLYRYGPDRDPARWRWVSWGAVAATVMWIAVSAGFSFYVSNFGNYNKTYGTLGAVVVLLLWFLISSYTVLFGAELNAEMEHQTEKDTTRGPDQPKGQRDAYVADNIGEAKRN